MRCLFAYCSVKHVLTIFVIWRVFYQRQKLLTISEHLSLPRVLVRSLLLIFQLSVSCFDFFFVLVVFVLRLVSPILLVSLYCPFLIAPSAFTIVFFILDQHTQFEYCRCGSLTQHSTGRHVAILYMKINFILQSVYLLYKYAIRIHFYFIRTRRINFSYYTNKLSWYPVAMYSGGRRQV